ncbi:hypothetical protein L227DRAFT_600325 [Lentinus tigrinus ALCF2SS1-6]|uniref:Uncharacterized protein n=1 Tax=Lentinus tigrinus ALCF2SS1-6 TaxID=1328759 RepID=A0A5C2SCC3_9APHY|nr:hypothetical protein L227DRAFT_600325 [Lentinus tigrinus ALCF2SS1-6]
MTETIPNELLETILFHALTIQTPVFETWRTHRTFCSNSPSGESSILLVSKRWCSLGTPVLYESAILRTNTRTEALARTLSDHKRRLGRYLRRLRVEGGFGGALIKVLNAAPGLATLYLGFDLTNKDSTAGLMRTLKQVKLEHLLLDSVNGRLLSNPTGINLSKTIAGALPHCKTLKRIDTSPRFVFLPDVLPALTQAPALEWISMSNFTVSMNIDGNVLAAVGRNPSVQVIQIRALDKSTPVELLRNIDEYARMKLYVGEGKNMVKLTEFPAADVVKEHPDSLPNLPDKVWDRIFDYATHVDDREMDESLFRLTRPSMNRTRKAILLVNKRFNRLGLRHMYSIPHLAWDTNVDRFIAVIEENHMLARLVRVLYLPEDMVFEKRKHILAPLASLERVTNHFIVVPDIAPFVHDWETLPLREASQSLEEGIIDSRLFKPFVNLRSLVLHDRYGAIVEDIPRDAFPKLESLEVWGWDLIDKFTPAELPSLRMFGFEAVSHVTAQAAKFLQVHGRKLDALSITGASDPQPGQPPHPLLDLCPNLTEIRMPSTRAPTNIPFLEHSQPHANIARLVFPKLMIKGTALDVDLTWDLFVEKLRLHRDKLPALKELHVLTSFSWPINSFEYDYFTLTPLIDDLHVMGIVFIDGSGTRWTRVLQRKWHRERVLRLQPAVPENEDPV